MPISTEQGWGGPRGAGGGGSWRPKIQLGPIARETPYAEGAAQKKEKKKKKKREKERKKENSHAPHRATESETLGWGHKSTNLL